MSLTNFELRRYIDTLDARMKPLQLAMIQPNPVLTHMAMLEAAHETGILMGLLQAKNALIELMNEAENKRQKELDHLRDLHGINKTNRYEDIPCDEQVLYSHTAPTFVAIDLETVSEFLRKEKHDSAVDSLKYVVHRCIMHGDVLLDGECPSCKREGEI